MNPLPTLDAMLADPTTGKDRLTRAVEAAVQSVVAELTAIEAFDAASGPESVYVFDRPVAAATRAAYEAWVAVAEPLEGRLAAAVARAGPIAGGDVLFRHLAKTRFRLSESLDDREQSVRDWLEGRTYSIEEVRRELRLPAKV